MSVVPIWTYVALRSAVALTIRSSCLGFQSRSVPSMGSNKRTLPAEPVPLPAPSTLPVQAPEPLPDGPNIMVAIIGNPSGRWSHEASSGSKLCTDFKYQLHIAGSKDKGAACGQAPALLGFAVVQAWHFAAPMSQCQHSASMRTCRQGAIGCGAQQKHVVLGHMEHRFFATVALRMPQLLKGSWAFCNPGLLGKELLQSTAHADFVVHASTGHASSLFSGSASLDDRWKHLLSEHWRGKCFAWPIWWNLGQLILCNKWMVDVTSVHPRAAGLRWDPPLMPRHCDILKYMKAIGSGDVQTILQPSSAPHCAHPTSLQFKKEQNQGKWDSRHLVAALRASQHCRRGKSTFAKGFLQYMLAYIFPSRHSEDMLAAMAPDFKAPSPTTMVNARLRLDVCAMLANRALFKKQPTLRYLFSDASPQRSGNEVFCACERLVLLSAANNAQSLGDIESCSFSERRLPICALGQGRTTLPDKVQCLIHQTWLEYGPSAADVRAANAAVRQCLSDMGTEFGICDYPDVVDERIAGKRAMVEGSQATRGFMFPLALQIPGVMHIIDLILQRATSLFKWWPEWSANSKLLMQFLHSSNQRQRIQEWLRTHAADQDDQDCLVQSLAIGGNPFAKWRWHTLKQVTSSMLRMRKALQLAASGPDGK